jgi:D-cysteine desulfhydrase
LLGADVNYVGDHEWPKVDEVMQDIAARERAQGRTPYVIPESGATVTGALGYLACGQELAQQARHGAPEFDTIVITAFSGGSQAGLLMARQVAGLRADVVSVPIAWTGERVREYVVDVIDRARKRYGLAVEPPQEVRLLDGFQGVGRADVRSEELETVLRLARLEGIIFDPVYTAKAFGGLLETLRRDPRALGRRVCFVHTGGVFSVFPFRESLSRLIDS